MDCFCEDSIKKSICKEMFLKHSFKFCRKVDHIIDSDICVKDLKCRIIQCDGKYKLLVQGIVCINVKYSTNSCYGKEICEESSSLPFLTLIAIPPCSVVKDMNICINNCKIYRCSCSEYLFTFILCIDVMILIKDSSPVISKCLKCFCDTDTCSLCNNIDIRDDSYPY